MLTQEVKMTIRVVVADDHPLLRFGVRAELANHHDIEIVGEATDGDGALQISEEMRPDVLLLDIHMPGLKAIQILSRLQRTGPAIRVIILTACDDVPTVIGMLKAGVKGYIVKDEGQEVLAEAIRVVVQGKTWLSPTVAGVIAVSLGEKNPKGEEALLTERELAILYLLGKGFTNDKIGEELFLSERIVRYQISLIIDKLGVHNRTEAVATAMKNGWIQL
jgi:DNA-binding NarL/FixJ family response regulator